MGMINGAGGAYGFPEALQFQLLFLMVVVWREIYLALYLGVGIGSKCQVRGLLFQREWYWIMIATRKTKRPTGNMWLLKQIDKDGIKEHNFE